MTLRQQQKKRSVAAPKKKKASPKKKTAARAGRKSAAPVDKKKGKERVAGRPPQRAPAENARARSLAHRLAELVLDKKASDVVILDVRGKTSYADYFVLASGESERQVAAMAEHAEVTLKTEKNVRVIGSEGQETGQWVLLDYGEVVAHLFFNEVRAFYDLEGLWADAPREAPEAAVAQALA